MNIWGSGRSCATTYWIRSMGACANRGTGTALNKCRYRFWVKFCGLDFDKLWFYGRVLGLWHIMVLWDRAHHRPLGFCQHLHILFSGWVLQITLLVARDSWPGAHPICWGSHQHLQVLAFGLRFRVYIPGGYMHMHTATGSSASHLMQILVLGQIL